jgi:hypothetical protein
MDGCDEETLKPTPTFREIIDSVADEWGIPPAVITGPRRTNRVVHARREVIRRLVATGRYSLARIGRLIGRDHTTIVYSVGQAKRKPPLKLKWKKPRVREMHCLGCRRALLASEPKNENGSQYAKAYLIPYAGADWADYKWRRRSNDKQDSSVPGSSKLVSR